MQLGLDLTPLRRSRDLRLLMLGDFVTAIGTQAALVALPFQIYSLTHSAFLTGLLGAAELVPLMAMALWGGALADRYDRRHLLLFVQVGLVAGGARAPVGPAPAAPHGPPAGPGAVPAGRRDGGLRRVPERDRLRDRAEPDRARSVARRARAELRPAQPDDGDRAGLRRHPDRRARDRRRVCGRCGELPGDDRRRLPALVPAPEASRARCPRGGARRVRVDRRGAALRPRQPGSHRLVLHRPRRDD